MRKRTLWFLFLCLPLLGIPRAASAQNVVPRYAKFEAAWTLPHQTGNPFDPAQNDIDVVFHGPHNQAATVPAFWDGNVWRVRFAPTAVGRYTLTVLRSGQPAHPLGLTATSFRCVLSHSPGFLRRDPKHIQHFLFDNGQSYYPLGIDQAWGGGGVPDYPQAFQLMHSSGLNWARIWMNNWDGKNLEWAANKADNPPIGQYDLAVARKWDAIFDAADKSNIYIQMTLQHHGQYTNRTDPNWADNPFNVANGGFLKQPQDFFTDPRAIQLTKNKFRYIVARWGYSTHLMAFELFNEVQNIGEVRNDFQVVVAWHKIMAAYIRSLDVDHHLLTTSNSVPGGRLASIGLDYDQIHTYVPDPLSYFASFDASGLTTPVFWGEWGASGAQTQAMLHDGLWAGLMVPVAGAPEYWYWDQVAKNNWWPTFRAATGYVAASGMAQQTGLRTLHPQVTADSQSGLTFAPLMGWGNTTGSDITVSPDGTVTGLAHVSSFIQGTGHRDMMPHPLAFHLNCAKPCQFQVLISTVSVAGAHPQISVDGTLAAEKNYPASARNHAVNDTLSVPLTAGPHVVTLFNTGPDWFTLSHVTVTDYAPALAVLAKGNARTVFFWAYNRDRAGAQPVTGALTLTGLRDGRCAVHLWNTQTGQALGLPMQARVTGGQLHVSLPPVTSDLGGWISR